MVCRRRARVHSLCCCCAVFSAFIRSSPVHLLSGVVGARSSARLLIRCAAAAPCVMCPFTVLLRQLLLGVVDGACCWGLLLERLLLGMLLRRLAASAGGCCCGGCCCGLLLRQLPLGGLLLRQLLLALGDAAGAAGCFCRGLLLLGAAAAAVGCCCWELLLRCCWGGCCWRLMFGGCSCCWRLRPAVHRQPLTVHCLFIRRGVGYGRTIAPSKLHTLWLCHREGQLFLK